MGINTNQGMKRVVLHFSATGSVNISGNSSTSDVALSNEVLTGAYIRKVWWGTDAAGASWTVKRGGNTVLILNTSGQMDFSEAGATITGNSAANVSCTLAGGNGFIMLELSKTGVFTPNNYSSQ